MSANEPKWTPGPWTNSDGLVNGIETRAGFGPSNRTSLDIFDAAEWPLSLDQEAQANAHLIAAAPELYEALELAIFCMVANEKIKNPEWDERATPTSAIGKARAILAKARGEQAAASTVFDEMIENPPFNPTEHEQTK